MKDVYIHPTAVVEKGAILEEGVVVEPYAVIKKNVTLKKGVRIKAHVHIEGVTTIGEDTVIYPFASIGSPPQSLKFQGENSAVEIGKRCEIREYVTMSGASQEGRCVSVGDDCFIMAYCHIAHDCKIGNRVVMSNGANLAGHVIVEDAVNIGGMTGIHQHVRIGRFAMVGGMSGIPCDVPPFTLGSGRPFEVAGLNLVGLKRNGFSFEVRCALTKAFRFVYRSSLSLSSALERIRHEVEMFEEVKQFVSFCESSKRGLVASHATYFAESLEEEREELLI